MKKRWLLILAGVLVLCGCSKKDTPVFETVGKDAYMPEEKPAAGIIHILIPEGATSQAMADTESGTVYTWEDNTLVMQTLDGGDIQKTVEQLTGIAYEDLTVMLYEKEGITYYRTVWSTAGEDGLLLGRAMIADDGYYHYCVSLLSPEESETQDIYDRICSSFAIRSEDEVK